MNYMTFEILSLLHKHKLSLSPLSLTLSLSINLQSASWNERLVKGDSFIRVQ